MNLLLSMSLAGSLVFLVYLVLRPLSVRFFSSAWRYRLLKLAILFYLLPYQYFKYYYYDIFYGIFFRKQYQSPEFVRGTHSFDFNNIILIDAKDNHLLKGETIIFVILTVWSMTVLSFAAYQVVKYISCKKTLRQITNIPDSGSYVILDQCKRETHIKKEIQLFNSSNINIPFTIGILSPCIIFPDTLKEEKSLYMAISHELVHIRNHDILTKFLALLVLALHWYNPLTYLLYWEICKVYECVCDETVIQNMTWKEKEEYKLLIVEMAQKSSQTNTIFANALSNNFKIIKERITFMDKSNISSKKMRIVSFAVGLLLFIVSSFPVLAYSPKTIVKSSFIDSNMSLDDEFVYLNIDQDTFYVFDTYDPFLEFGTDHDIFVDKNGISNIVYGTTSQIERSVCNHTWKSGQIHHHSKGSSGGCTVYIYEAQTCSKCNQCILGNLINSIQYTVCPH